MDYKQIIIIAIAATAIGRTFLFPRWMTLRFSDSGPSHVLLTHSERRLFNDPPERSDVKAPYIAWGYSVQDAVAAVVVAGILCFFLRTKKTQEDVTANDCPVSTAAF